MGAEDLDPGRARTIIPEGRVVACGGKTFLREEKKLEFSHLAPLLQETKDLADRNVGT